MRTDPDKNPLTYAVTAGPSDGVLTPCQPPERTPTRRSSSAALTPYQSDTFTATAQRRPVLHQRPRHRADHRGQLPGGHAHQRGIAGPNHVAVSATRAYITNTFDGTVSVIDTNTNNVIATIGVGEEPGAVAVRGNHVYVANYVSGTVSVIDATNNTVTATIPVGARPVGIAPTPDGTKVYVRNGYDVGTVTVINLVPTQADNTVIKIILCRDSFERQTPPSPRQ